MDLQRERLSPKLQEIYDHWQSLAAEDGAIPNKADFDPMRVPHLLPNIFLLKVIGRPPRFQFRLLGEAILEAGGPGRRDLFVDALPRTDAAASFHEQLTELVRTRSPFWYKGPPTLKHHRHVVGLEGIMLPLADPDGGIGTVLCLTVYHWENGQMT